MDLKLRPGRLEDAEVCGRICYEAFKEIAETHNFPPDFPSPEVATGLLSWFLSDPRFYSVVAEVEGRVVGSNFLDERNVIAGVGPITIDPTVQNKKVGRRLMEDVHAEAARKNFVGVRLLQSGYHGRSLSLYTRLGYEVREPITCLQGPALNIEVPGYGVRAATEADLDACNSLCRRVHGHDRAVELMGAIQHGTARVVESEGRITGYATSIAFFAHAVAETNGGLQALIGAAKEFLGPGFLLPTRNGELFRWCLERGLRVVQPLTLMSKGLYNEPAGAFLPSILY
ncbi:MAG TPA: GNAT family N-acetyltransferase [Chthoniobacterales bacterium]|jgi:GNAT superfamily N-acetyltransferase|nr:GNAT family N-acetyltransferase [Chthoniobacterales bacterium]